MAGDGGGSDMELAGYDSADFPVHRYSYEPDSQVPAEGGEERESDKDHGQGPPTNDIRPRS